jgi:hypothetical protein
VLNANFSYIMATSFSGGRSRSTRREPPTSKLYPGLVNYKKGALDSQPQVIKFTSCLPIVGRSLWVLRLLPPLKLVAMISSIRFSNYSEGVLCGFAWFLIFLLNQTDTKLTKSLKLICSIIRGPGWLNELGSCIT